MGRVAAAIAVVAVAFSAAVYVHQRQPTTERNANPFLSERHQPWQDPIAVLIAIGGVAVAFGIYGLRRQERV